MNWVFQKSPKMGGATGEAFASTLRSSGMAPEHVLAREAIQNSVDARLDDDRKVEIRFRERHLSGREKKAFLSALQVGDIAPRAEFLGLQDPSRFEQLKDANKKLHLVYVEDYNAVGLGGDPHERTSNFYRLLLSLGDRSKARDSQGSGGSYGFGKSVYSANSFIQTIVAYTRWVDRSTGESGTRLFGCGYYASHDFGGQGFSGRAWLGSEPRTDEDGELVVDPLENAQADEFAKQLGFEVRKKGETGTSILLVDAPVKLAEIRRGIEDWWWPRLLMGRLDVSLTSATGDKEFPRIMQRAELRPFIESFRILTGQSEEAAGRTKYHRLYNMGSLPIGTCGFSTIELDDDGEPKLPEELRNTVALVRKPLMVVSYFASSTLTPAAVGAFLAADEIDDYLKRSEPPEHNKWSSESENLRDEDGVGRQVVDRVLQSVRSGLRKFQHAAAPPAPPKQKRLAQLERVLGTYFTPRGLGVPKGEASQTPIHVNFVKAPMAEETDNGKLKLTSSFRVSLADDAPSESVRLELNVRCPVVEEEDGEGEDLRLFITCDGEVDVPDPNHPEIVRFTFEPGESYTFHVESEEYEPMWTVKLRPEIERVEE